MRARGPIYLFGRHPSETDRLDVQHYALREAVGANYAAPVCRPERILDVGCGTGQWAYDLSGEFPEALVVGLDVAPVKPCPPANFRFVRSNVLRGLPFGEARFDLVHQRMMAASAVPLRSWSALIRELARVTRPDGWVELVEPDPRVDPEGPHSRELWAMAKRMVDALGLDMSGFVPETLGRYLRTAGLVDVCTRDVLLPVGEWGGTLGSLMASNYRGMGARLSEAIEKQLGVPAAEYREVLRLAGLEWEEHHSQVRYRFAWGRKPIS
jgi:SAM-dependent methyltransferase